MFIRFPQNDVFLSIPWYSALTATLATDIYIKKTTGFVVSFCCFLLLPSNRQIYVHRAHFLKRNEGKVDWQFYSYRSHSLCFYYLLMWKKNASGNRKLRKRKFASNRFLKSPKNPHPSLAEDSKNDYSHGSTISSEGHENFASARKVGSGIAEGSESSASQKEYIVSGYCFVDMDLLDRGPRHI